MSDTTAHEEDPTPSAKPSEFDPRDYRSLGNWEVALDGFHTLVLRGQIVALFDNLALVRLLEGTSPSIVSGPGMIEFKTKSNPFGPALLIDYRWRQVRQFVDGARYVFLGIDTLVWAKPTKRLPEGVTKTPRPIKLPLEYSPECLSLDKEEIEKLKKKWSETFTIRADRLGAGLGVPKELIDQGGSVRKADELMTKRAKSTTFVGVLPSFPFPKGDSHCKYCGANRHAYEKHASTCAYMMEVRRRQKELNDKADAETARRNAEWKKAHHIQTREEFLKTFERRMPPKRTVTFHMEPMFDVEEE